MLRIYELDKQRVYTGTHKDVGPRERIPRNWTHIEPPETAGYAIFDGKKWFTRDEYPEAEAPPPERRIITVGAFYDRFGDKKWEILSSDNPLINAVIKDVSVREYVDLDNPQLPEGLQLIVDNGIEIDVDEVLSAGIEERERPG